jgi:hypothetical protein
MPRVVTTRPRAVATVVGVVAGTVVTAMAVAAVVVSALIVVAAGAILAMVFRGGVVVLRILPAGSGAARAAGVVGVLRLVARPAEVLARPESSPRPRTRSRP